MCSPGHKGHDDLTSSPPSSALSAAVLPDCIERNCVRDGKVYEIYKQKSFFNENTRVKAVEVEILEIETKDIPETKDMVAIVSGIDSISRQYFAVVPKEGLTDGETVTISE